MPKRFFFFRTNNSTFALRRKIITFNSFISSVLCFSLSSKRRRHSCSTLFFSRSAAPSCSRNDVTSCSEALNCSGSISGWRHASFNFATSAFSSVTKHKLNESKGAKLCGGFADATYPNRISPCEGSLVRGHSQIGWERHRPRLPCTSSLHGTK